MSTANGSRALRTGTTQGGRFTSRIIKASALLDETKVLLHQWNAELSVEENLVRVKSENLLGCPSRSRLEDILLIFRRRYLSDQVVANALSILVKGKMSPIAVDQVLYHYALQADGLLHDFVAQVLYPRYRAGRTDLATYEVMSSLAEWQRAGRMVGNWSEETVSRVAQGLLAALRDFRVLEGAVSKRLVPAPLAIEAFAFVALDRSRSQPSGARLLRDPFWRVFFLDDSLVERQFLAAHQQGLLHYSAAGSIVRLEFPVISLDQYARFLTDNANPQHAGTEA